MELVDILHAPKEKITDFEPHAFIAASGYESRSINIPNQFSKLRCKKIALCFSEQKNALNRTDNDQFFSDNNYQMIQLSVNDNPPFSELLDDIRQEELRVVIDISVMTKTWYYALLRYVYEVKGVKRFLIRIVYSQAKFNSPPGMRAKKMQLIEQSLTHEVRKSNKRKETVLLMGLGNEKGIGYKIFQKLKPDRTILFYADPSIVKDYVESVLINNHDLIREVAVRDLINYSIEDTKSIYSALINKVLPLRENNQIILVPQGPKIFSLVAMILQLSYPDITLFLPRIKRTQIKDRVAVDRISSLDLHFGLE